MTKTPISQNKKYILLYSSLALFAIIATTIILNIINQPATIPLSQAINDFKAGKVQEIEVESSKLTIHEGDKKYLTYKNEQDNIYQILKDAHASTDKTNIVVKDTVNIGGWIGIMGIIFPIIYFLLPPVLMIVIIYNLRRIVKALEKRPL